MQLLAEQKIAVNVLIEQTMKANDDGSDNITFNIIGSIINQMGSQAINLIREKIKGLKKAGMTSDNKELDNLILVSSCFDED